MSIATLLRRAQGRAPQQDPAAAERKRRAATRAWLRDLKLSRGCLDCGSLERLEFDHRDPATKAFTIGKCPGLSRARLLAEIRRCDVRCRACHLKSPNHTPKSHCPNGHAFDEQNTRIRHRDGSTERVCRVCARARGRATKRRRSEKRKAHAKA